MDVLVILDGGAKSPLSEELRAGIGSTARARGYGVREVELGRDDLPPCLGCLRCITRHAGICVHQDSLERLAGAARDCPLVVFLSPARFGTCSSTIKNALDKAGHFIPHYGSCRQVVIGYGADVDEEERSTFLDIIGRHRGSADIVHPKMEEHIEARFCASAEEGRRICESLGRLLEPGRTA